MSNIINLYQSQWLREIVNRIAKNATPVDGKITLALTVDQHHQLAKLATRCVVTLKGEPYLYEFYDSPGYGRIELTVLANNPVTR
jgi:hypothetical protein